MTASERNKTDVNVDELTTETTRKHTHTHMVQERFPQARHIMHVNATQGEFVLEIVIWGI